MKRHYVLYLWCLPLIVAAIVVGQFGSSPVVATGAVPGPSAGVPRLLTTVSTTLELRRGLNGYNGVADTYLLANEGAVSPHGGEDTLHIKASAYATKRSLIRFDLAAAGIPSNATITEAWLELFVSYRYPANPASVTAYYLLKPWDEASATWNVASTGQGWASPGAGSAGSDYEATAAASAAFSTSYAYNRINVKSAVERWLQNPDANYGLLLMGSTIDLRVWSSEDVREDERPRLVITYDAPSDYTPEPTRSATPTRTPSADASPTPTPANYIYSTGLTEAFGTSYPNCIEAGPSAVNPDNTEVLLIWQGQATTAKLSFLYSGNNNRHHSVLVNDQIIGALPGDNWQSVCTGGSSAQLSFDPALVVSGENKISILADVPGETNSWSLQNPRIQLGGYVQGTDISVVELTSSYDGTTQRAMIQKPIGYSTSVATPLVLGLHGWGGRDYDAMTWLAEACNNRGWLLACSDTRNDNQHTASKAVQHDVMDLLNYMLGSDEYNVDASRVYLIGSSMGGMMAATIAAKYPDRFAALAELKGPTSLDAWYYEIEAWRQAVIYTEMGTSPANAPFSYQRASAAAMARNLRNVPTLIIHGLNDVTVPYHHAEDLYTAMVASDATDVALYPFTGGHSDDHPNWNNDQIMGFFAEHTLNANPLTVTVRTDEPKSYYWMNISHGVSDHWTQASAYLNPDTQTVTLEVFDERATPASVDITLDFTRMGLPTGVAYTVEDANLTTGEFFQYSTQASSTLVLTVPRDRHRLTIYPFTAAAPQSITLRQGEGGYQGMVDTYIESYVRDANHDAEGLRVSFGGNRTPLLRFDLAGRFDERAVIKSAQFGVYSTAKWNSSDSITTGIYKVLTDWTSTQATWDERFSGASWNQAGALGSGEDYDPTLVSSNQMANIGAWYRYNVTDLVREWVANPQNNHGLLIRGETGLGTFTLNSSEGASYKPELIIYYTEATNTPTPTITPTPTYTATPTVTRTPTQRPTPTNAGRVYLPAIVK